MAVYGYPRVSTSRQAEEGESLDVQQRIIAGYALMLGLTVTDLGGDVTGDGIRKLVFTILSAVAEAERDCIREQVTQVKRD
jgi:DNA invertase Pin-like site-specific DNA recombinase